MKYIFFDIDSNGLLSQDGRPRPYMEVVLAYCHYSKIKVYLATSTPERVSQFQAAYPDAWGLQVMGEFTKGGEIPHQPDLVISADAEYLRKWPGLQIPPYNPDSSIQFAELSLAGRMLDTIRDRVVLNKDAPEKKPVRPAEPERTEPEDPSQYGFSV